VFKAEAALDAASSAANNSNNGGGGGAGISSAPMATVVKKFSADREKVQCKLDFATALAHLGQANYEKAAYYFLRLGSAKDLGDWIGKVCLPNCRSSTVAD